MSGGCSTSPRMERSSARAQLSAFFYPAGMHGQSITTMADSDSNLLTAPDIARTMCCLGFLSEVQRGLSQGLVVTNRRLLPKPA